MCRQLGAGANSLPYIYDWATQELQTSHAHHAPKTPTAVAQALSLCADAQPSARPRCAGFLPPVAFYLAEPHTGCHWSCPRPT